MVTSVMADLPAEQYDASTAFLTVGFGNLTVSL